MIRRTMMGIAAVALGACGGSKAPAPDTSAGAQPAPAVAAPTADSAKADSARLATDSAAKAAASSTNPAIVGPGAVKVTPSKADSVGFDKALKPKFQIDEKTGKVTPIKRP